jgi:hypothetical protein
MRSALLKCWFAWFLMMSFLPVLTVKNWQYYTVIGGPNNRLTGNGKNHVGNTNLHVYQQQTNVNSLVDLRSPREKKWIEPGDLRQCWNNLFEIPTEVVLRHDKERQCLAPYQTCLRGRRRTYLTILKRAWSADSKMVKLVLLWVVTSKAGSRK